MNFISDELIDAATDLEFFFEMASNDPEDSVSVKMYSIFDRPEGEIAQMGKISVSKKFDPDETSAFNGWAYLQRSRRPKVTDYLTLKSIFEETLRAELMEKAKKRAKELHANAILDLNIDEGYSAWKCTGTAVRVLKSAKKESSSEDAPPAKKMKPVAAQPKK